MLIAGDLVPTKSNMDLFSSANVEALLGGELLSIWNSADKRIFNLEVPLADNESPIEKCGPNLIAAACTAEGIKALNPSLVTLANNHIMDQGEKGLKSTQWILNDKDIRFSGAGDNLAEASKPFIICEDGLKVGIYACAEHEYSIAAVSEPGANPFDPLESLDHISKLKDECDYVIVFYHGGKEHYRYPSPYLKKVCRKMALKGADLVICQHSHCVGCMEKYEGSTIVYGQGNFIFDDCDSEFWQTSLLVSVGLSDEQNIEFIPIVKNGNGVRLPGAEDAARIMEEFTRRSGEILEEGFVERQYEKVASESLESYLRGFSGSGKWQSRFDRYLLKGSLLKHKYDKNRLLLIRNTIECEAHRELIIEGLKKLAR